MQKHILDASKKIMCSGQHLLPASPQFIDLVGRCGELDGVMRLLRGQVEWTDLRSEHEIALIIKSMKALQCESSFPLISQQTMYQEFKKMFSATKESTASSPSGLHVHTIRLGQCFPKLVRYLQPWLPCHLNTDFHRPNGGDQSISCYRK